MRILRGVLSVLLALLAGLSAALAFAAARADALLHEPEPLQQIAAPLAEDPRIQAGLPPTIASAVEEQLPQQVPDALQDGAGQLAEDAADQLIQDERFDEAWQSALEQTRTDWLDDLQAVREQQEAGEQIPVDAATAELELGPIVELGQQNLEEGLRQLPFGDAAADALLPDDTSFSLPVDLNLPDPETVSAEQVADAEQLVQHWPWAGVVAAVLFVLSLLVAPARRRWLPWVAAGLAVLGSGALARYGLNQISAPGMSGLEQDVATSLIEGIQGWAMPDTTLLMVGGAVLIAVGVIVGLVTAAVSSRR